MKIWDATANEWKIVHAQGPQGIGALVDEGNYLSPPAELLAGEFLYDPNAPVSQAIVGDGSITTMRAVTQAAYNALGTPDPNTFYAIIG
jgi:hypothetical protein